MTPSQERELVEAVMQLFSDRNDMVVGIVATFIDIYKNQMQMTGRHQAHIIASLQLQLDHCAKYPHEYGTKFLGALIQALKEDKLDAAKLLREAPAGTA